MAVSFSSQASIQGLFLNHEPRTRPRRLACFRHPKTNDAINNSLARNRQADKFHSWLRSNRLALGKFHVINLSISQPFTEANWIANSIIGSVRYPATDSWINCSGIRIFRAGTITCVLSFCLAIASGVLIWLPTVPHSDVVFRSQFGFHTESSHSSEISGSGEALNDAPLLVLGSYAMVGRWTTERRGGENGVPGGDWNTGTEPNFVCAKFWWNQILSLWKGNTGSCQLQTWVTDFH